MYRARTLVAGPAAVALAVGTVVVGAPTAWAGRPALTATGDVVCSHVSGTIRFLVPLTPTGPTTGQNNAAVKMTLSDCNAFGSNVSANTATGKVTGNILWNNGSSCSGFFGVQSAAATLKVKWAGFNAKLDQSTIELSQIDGETAGLGGNAALAYGARAQQTTAPDTTFGSFATSNGSAELDTALTSGELTSACGLKRGLKQISLVGGNVVS